MTAAFMGLLLPRLGSTRKLAKKASMVACCFSKSSVGARATSR